MAHTLEPNNTFVSWRRPSHQPSTSQGGWVHKLLQNDHGAASADLVLITPLVLLLVLVIVQFALWSHATHIAQAAATQGLAATRVQEGTAEAGTESAHRLLDQLARGPLDQVDVSIHRGTESASVHITGTARSVVPFVQLPVRAEATGPVERFVPTDGTASP